MYLLLLSCQQDDMLQLFNSINLVGEGRGLGGDGDDGGDGEGLGGSDIKGDKNGAGGGDIVDDEGRCLCNNINNDTSKKVLEIILIMIRLKKF